MNVFESEPINATYAKIYPPAYLQKLQAICQEEGITLQSLTLGAFIYALKKLDYQEDLILGLVAHNRPTVADGDKILGCFLNTLPYRLNLQAHQGGDWRRRRKNGGGLYSGSEFFNHYSFSAADVTPQLIMPASGSAHVPPPPYSTLPTPGRRGGTQQQRGGWRQLMAHGMDLGR